MTEIDAGGLPIFRAYPTTTTRERFIREFILQLKAGPHQPRLFPRQSMARIPRVRFKERFDELAAEGYPQPRR